MHFLNMSLCLFRLLHDVLSICVIFSMFLAETVGSTFLATLCRSSTCSLLCEHWRRNSSKVFQLTVCICNLTRYKEEKKSTTTTMSIVERKQSSSSVELCICKRPTHTDMNMWRHAESVKLWFMFSHTRFPIELENICQCTGESGYLEIKSNLLQQTNKQTINNRSNVPRLSAA